MATDTITATAKIEPKRGIIAVATLAAALLALANAAGNVLARDAPATALRFAPGQPIALNTFAAQNLSREPSAIAGHISRSLGATALNPYALELFGLVAADRRAFVASAVQSRRYLGAQLFLAQNAVARGDVIGAMAHYDNALRGSINAPPLVLKLLVRATADSRLIDVLAGKIRERPRWLGDFIRAAIPATTRPDLLALTIVRAGGLPRTEEFAEPQITLAQRLLDRGAYGALSALHRVRGNDPTVPTTLAVNSKTTDPAQRPLGWQPMQRDEIRGEVTGGAIAADVAPWTSGVAAGKLLFTRSGRYRLNAISETERVNTAWRISCVGVAGPRILADSPPGRDTVEVRVPADCPLLRVEWLVATRETRGRAVLKSAELRRSP